MTGLLTAPAAGGPIVARLYDSRGEDRTIDLPAGALQDIRDDQLLWIDVDGREPEALRAAAEACALQPSTIRLLAEPRSRALLRRHDDYVHLGLRCAQPGHDGSLAVVGLDLIAAPNLVVTVRDGPIDAFDRFRDEIDDMTHVGALDAATFTAAIVDAILAGYLLLVEDLERRIDTLDQRALRSRNATPVIDELAALRGRAATLRRALAPHRHAFAALARPDFALHERLGRPWPGLLDRLDATLAMVESARDLLIGTFDLVMTRTAQRTNDTVKTLTIVSVVLLPASLVAGVMGMNFQLPLFQDSANFWWVVGAMLVVMVATLVVALVRDAR